jgi:2-polyprenyl-6-methoxyphenol hydroxylase-like FAD-dependent oxidoreductase
MARMIRVDVAIVGGGVAGSSLATVLQRQGMICAVIEREPVFRDRVRGEGLHPWGYREAVHLGIDSIVHDAGAQPLPFWQSYSERAPIEPWRWDDDPENEYPEFSLFHPRLQESADKAAQEAGAIVIRPATAKQAVRTASGWQVIAERFNGNTIEVIADLLVGADGRTSVVQKWLGIETQTDPHHHRFGGMLLEGVEFRDDTVHAVGFEGGIAYLLPQGHGRARAYGGAVDRVIDQLAADKTGAAYLDLMRSQLPEGSLSSVTLAGPMAFFSNADIVPDRLTGDRAVLIGDAAGANDPSVGQGLSLTFRDIRELSELLKQGSDPQAAIEEYARRRSAYHATVREHAKWIAELNMEEGGDLAERRAKMRQAKELDPTQGGFAFMYTRGPIGLVADRAAREHYFGNDL